jgi:hypothetical protein
MCQDHDPLCFERELEARIRAIGNCPFSLIDDVRKLSAFEFFAERGYSTLRIDAPELLRRSRMLERDGYLPSEDTFIHSSEIDLDGIHHDFSILNESKDILSFYEQIDAVLLAIASPQHVN